MNSREDVEKKSDKDIPTLEAPKELEPVVGLDENFKKSHLKIIIYPLLSKKKKNSVVTLHSISKFILIILYLQDFVFLQLTLKKQKF